MFTLTTYSHNLIFQQHTAICEKDPGFYQVCGHVTCPQYQYQREAPMLCGSFMCNYEIQHPWEQDENGDWWQTPQPRPTYVNEGYFSLL